MITFIVWKWRGWRGNIYRADRINAFCRMLSANLSIPHRILCITDDSAGIDVDTYPLWDEFENLGSTGKPNCFRRLRLLDGDFSRQFGDRLVSIDADAVIRSDISHLFTDEDFRILRGRNARYNGSLWMLTPGANQHVWNNFCPINSPKLINAARDDLYNLISDSPSARLIGSDQAWMSLQIKDAATWDANADAEIVSYVMDCRDHIPPQAKIVFFQGGAKPWDYSVRAKHPSLWNEFAKWHEYRYAA